MDYLLYAKYYSEDRKGYRSKVSKEHNSSKVRQRVKKQISKIYNICIRWY